MEKTGFTHIEALIASSASNTGVQTHVHELWRNIVELQNACCAIHGAALVALDKNFMAI